MGIGHIHRLLRLITLLQGRRGYNAATLAHELAVSRRTIYRDLNALELAGVPYHYDPESRGYFINGDFFLPPVQLTLREAMSLSVLASQLAKQRQIPFLDGAWQAMVKIESQLPPTIREELAATGQNLFVQAARVSPQEDAEGHFRTLTSAIAMRRKVRCVYDGGSDGRQGKAFLFRPYAMFFSQRAWYAIGYSELRGDERCLKLNRLKETVQTDRPYMIPGSWDLESYLGKAWRMIRGDRRYHVAIRFDGEFARTMSETLWHPTQKVTFQKDGSCLFECEVDGLAEIVWWVLAYGPHAEAIAPRELRVQVLHLAQAICGVYRPKTARSGRTTRGKVSAAALAIAGSSQEV